MLLLHQIRFILSFTWINSGAAWITITDAEYVILPILPPPQFSKTITLPYHFIQSIKHSYKMTFIQFHDTKMYILYHISDLKH